MSGKSMKGMPSRIEIMVLKLRTMQITTNEFLDFLKDEQIRLKEVITKVKGVLDSKDTPTEGRECVMDEVNTGVMGLESLIQAAQYLEKYRDLPTKSILDTGVVMAKRGQDLLNIAMDMNIRKREEIYDNFMAISEKTPQDDMFTNGMFGSGMISIY